MTVDAWHVTRSRHSAFTNEVRHGSRRLQASMRSGEGEHEVRTDPGARISVSHGSTCTASGQWVSSRKKACRVGAICARSVDPLSRSDTERVRKTCASSAVTTVSLG